MAKLLDEARGEARRQQRRRAAPVADSGVDCTSVKGLQHEIIDTATGNTPLSRSRRCSAATSRASKVSVMYRPEGATDFTEVKHDQAGRLQVHRHDPRGRHEGLARPLLRRGATTTSNKADRGEGLPGSPNIIEVTAGAGRRRPRR